MKLRILGFLLKMQFFQVSLIFSKILQGTWKKLLTNRKKCDIIYWRLSEEYVFLLDLQYADVAERATRRSKCVAFVA